MSYSRICSEDRAVLNTIFNPLLPLGEIYTNDFLPNENGPDNSDYDKCCSADEKLAAQLELKAVQLAESGDLSAALDAFTHAIEKSPHRPSGYNNRAQVHRIQGNINFALEDLNKAVELSGGGQGKSGSQALCQRALLMLKLEKRQEAIADFTAAARNGSHFAKAQTEVDDTLKRIQSHKGVVGTIVISGEGVPIRSTLDNSMTVHYAAVITEIIEKTRNGVRDLDPTNELTILRIRTKKHEIMIAPDAEFIMIVIQEPVE